MRNAFSYIQWKIAMARMQDASVAASEITERVALPTPIGSCRPPSSKPAPAINSQSTPRHAEACQPSGASRKMYGGVNASRTLGSCTAA
jgi:hypothetical protein